MKEVFIIAGMNPGEHSGFYNEKGFFTPLAKDATHYDHFPSEDDLRTAVAYGRFITVQKVYKSDI